MTAAPMCFSMLQTPKCRIYTVANFWSGSIHGWTRRFGSSSKLHDSKIQCLEGGGTAKKWTRRPVTTKAEGSNKAAWSSKANSIKREILEGTVTSSTTLNINNATEISQIQKIQYCDIQQDTDKDKEVAKDLTVIVFDIETTGFSRENERIIEIALRDLSGGENSTFQTLVNPDRFVANYHIHGITSNMVERPGVPRMPELIPILIQYVKSRQKPGGLVVLVAHNARSFDVPFLIKEFNRCGIILPSDWKFLDTVPLAREMMKSKGLKSPKLSLQSLREGFGIPQVGSAHRAMSDVICLSHVLQQISYNLKLSHSDIVARSFSASDLNSQKKKKSSG